MASLSLMPTFIEALPDSALHRNDAIHIINLSQLFHVDLKKKKEVSTSPFFFSYLQLKVFFSMRVGRYKSYLFFVYFDSSSILLHYIWR